MWGLRVSLKRHFTSMCGHMNVVHAYVHVMYVCAHMPCMNRMYMRSRCVYTHTDLHQKVTEILENITKFTVRECI